ncbi:TAXI family TRAP transporter solute-binding subunit [Candidatus Margulisiibacteriota bacterium]
MRRHFKNIAFFLLILSFLFTTACTKSTTETTTLTIGTGGLTGVYYPTGGNIASIVNDQGYNFQIEVQSTAGSVYNINAVLDGTFDLGIAQSDRQYQAYNGTADWASTGAQTKLRAVFSIYPESVTLLASILSGINSISDLVGKNVNLGNSGSGHLQNAKDILDAFGVSENNLSAQYLAPSEAPALLQNQTIDAFFYTVGHPNTNILDATSGNVSVKIIDIQGTQLDTLLAKYSYYAASTIPISLYPNATNQIDVNTFGVKATLVTSSDVDADTIYKITKAIFESLTEFKQLHSAYSTMTQANMLTGLPAPLHDGALRYYQEIGLK